MNEDFIGQGKLLLIKTSVPENKDSKITLPKFSDLERRIKALCLDKMLNFYFQILIP